MIRGRPHLKPASSRLITLESTENGGRCFKAVDSLSEGSPKLIAIDEETDHQVVHALRLGKADRPAHQPLDPRAQVDVLVLDLLRVCLPYRVLLGLHMPLVGRPAVGEIARDAKRRQ